MRISTGVCLALGLSAVGCHDGGDEHIGRNVSALSVTTTADASTLASAILGDAAAVTVRSVTYSGASVAAGVYTDGPLGIPDGTILTTGSAITSLPPSDGGNLGTNLGRSGDSLCDALVPGYSTYDAAKLTIEFDLSADFDGISFLSIFGSEEYPEYVGSAFNDTFGVYLNGQQIVYDEAGDPISINGAFFSSSNVVVAPATMSEYDGSTNILQTQAPLQGGTTGNVLEIVICDGGDAIYDSGVFITALRGCVGPCNGTEICAGVDQDGDGIDACDDCDDGDPSVGVCGGGGDPGDVEWPTGLACGIAAGNGQANGHDKHHGGAVESANDGDNPSCGHGTQPQGDFDGYDNDCTPAPAVPGAEWIEIEFDRTAAVTTALALSELDPDSMDGVPDLEHHSAYFMSLVYRAGGIPMVQNGAEANGWNARYGSNGVLDGNAVWNAHNYAGSDANGDGIGDGIDNPAGSGALISYLSGCLGTLDDQVELEYVSPSNLTQPYVPPGNCNMTRIAEISSTPALNFGVLLTESLRGKRIDTNGDGTVDPRDQFYFSKEFAVRLAEAEWLTTYRPGDYVYIDSGYPYNIGAPTHGLVIVGLERPISCREEIRSQVVHCDGSDPSCPPGTIRFTGSDDGLPDDYVVPEGTLVPYVVDWTNVQTQRARPFYCTIASTNGDWFTHRSWTFIRAPDRIRVRANAYVPPNFQVTIDGAIELCPSPAS